MDKFLEIIQKRSPLGILIFDRQNKLICSNGEAETIICRLNNKKYAGKSRLKIKDKDIPPEILSLLNSAKRNGAAANGASAVLDSEENPPFVMRAFLISGKKNEKPNHTLVIFEKLTEKHHGDFEKIKKEFKLTEREMEILNLICKGTPNKEIAETLSIQLYTVKDHVKHIMKKMNLHSREKIIARASLD